MGGEVGLETRGLQIGLGHHWHMWSPLSWWGLHQWCDHFLQGWFHLFSRPESKNHQIENMSKDIIVYIYIINIVYNLYIYIVYSISLQINTYQKISEYIWYQSLHSHTLLVSLEVKHGERSDPFKLAIILRQGLSSKRYGHEFPLGMKRAPPAHFV